jgi:hypothetical protein
MVGSVCRVKLFTTGSRNSLKDVRKSQMMPPTRCGSGRDNSKKKKKTVMLRVSTHWYSYGTSVINVGEGYVEK